MTAAMNADTRSPGVSPCRVSPADAEPTHETALVRAVLIPATMRLLGGWYWWAPGENRANPSPIGDSGLDRIH